MNALEAYKSYLALRLHFTSEYYDYFKYKGHVKANAEKFSERRDKYFFEKLVKNLSNEDVIEFLVANFITNPKIWVGNMNEENYLDWKKKVESLLYRFEQETKILSNLSNGSIKSLLYGTENSQPIFLKALLSGDITDETFLVYDAFIHLISHFDRILPSDLVWVNRSFKLKKYKPFIHKYLVNDIDKYKKVIREAFLNDN